MLNTIQEEYRPVVGFENLYEVSNLGNVRSYRRLMTQSKINSGYIRVRFCLNGHKTSELVHRAVAKAFLPNPENKREVNHKDGDRTNNVLSNLEWATSSENKQHARKVLGAVYNKPTIGIKKGSASKYYNVTYDKARHKWKACVRHNKVNYFQKRFMLEEDAALHVNWVLDQLGLTDRPRNIVYLNAQRLSLKRE